MEIIDQREDFLALELVKFEIDNDVGSISKNSLSALNSGNRNSEQPGGPVRSGDAAKLVKIYNST
jgi:hypothetical protein